LRQATVGCISSLNEAPSVRADRGMLAHRREARNSGVAHPTTLPERRTPVPWHTPQVRR
jgi:hypothetical protein